MCLIPHDMLHYKLLCALCFEQSFICSILIIDSGRIKKAPTGSFHALSVGALVVSGFLPALFLEYVEAQYPVTDRVAAEEVTDRLPSFTMQRYL